MKKIIVFVFVVVLLATGGCGGYRSAMLDPDQKVRFNDTNVSIFERPIDPIELARSKAIIVEAESKAQLNKALAEQITKGNSASIIGQYIGLFINDDPCRTVEIMHPTMSQQIIIPPGGYEFITASTVPKNIIIRFRGDRCVFKKRIYDKAGIYNGVKYDFGARVDAQRY